MQTFNKLIWLLFQFFYRQRLAYAHSTIRSTHSLGQCVQRICLPLHHEHMYDKPKTPWTQYRQQYSSKIFSAEHFTTIFYVVSVCVRSCLPAVCCCTAYAIRCTTFQSEIHKREIRALFSVLSNALICRTCGYRFYGTAFVVKCRA